RVQRYQLIPGEKQRDKFLFSGTGSCERPAVPIWSGRAGHHPLYFYKDPVACDLHRKWREVMGFNVARQLPNRFQRVLELFWRPVHPGQRELDHTGDHLTGGDIELRVMERAGDDLPVQRPFRERCVLVAAAVADRVDLPVYVREGDLDSFYLDMLYCTDREIINGCRFNETHMLNLPFSSLFPLLSTLPVLSV